MPLLMMRLAYQEVIGPNQENNTIVHPSLCTCAHSGALTQKQTSH